VGPLIFILRNVLTPAEIATVTNQLKTATWQDGGETAHYTAQGVKSNQQALGADVDEVRRLTSNALMRHEQFRRFAMPKHHSVIMFSRYRPGMEYGLHVDHTLIAARNNDRIRSDMSVTLFLSEPDTYKGGELRIAPAGLEQTIKLAAGDAVLYPTSSLHRVMPITEGERLAAVLWIQSMVRDVGEREILINLERVMRELFAKDGKTELVDLVSNSYFNLYRKWADI
jgi:PKHD-type hydroxylase